VRLVPWIPFALESSELDGKARVTTERSCRQLMPLFTGSFEDRRDSSDDRLLLGAQTNHVTQLVRDGRVLEMAPTMRCIP